MDALLKKCLEKILSSKEFEHSKIYQSYLTYLVEATCAGKELKETTIAIEFFGKDARFNPAEDTIVRSHTYNLRKKLDSYYLTEGKEDKWRLTIPKGHYEVRFILVDEYRNRPRRLLRRVMRDFFFFLSLVLCVALGLLWRHYRQAENRFKTLCPIDASDPIWGDILRSPLPTLLVLGDHFFFNEYSEKYQSTTTVRIPQINSAEEFSATYPGFRVDTSTEPYFPYHSLWSLPPILSVFLPYRGKSLIMRKSSDVTPQILDEYNIVFVGSLKTLYTLRNTLLLKSHFDYRIAPHRVFYTVPGTDSVRIFETSLHSRGPNDDLVLALKLPGPSQNAIVFIASYHSLGAPEIASYLTTPSRKKELEARFLEQYNRIPPYFEVLFRVTGIDKTAYDTEILVLGEISAEGKKISP